jgi:hypothetical protein
MLHNIYDLAIMTPFPSFFNLQISPDDFRKNRGGLLRLLV